MNVYIVFAHPSTNSFNKEVLNAFIKGLEEAGHIYEIGDLYRMNFKSEMDIEEYQREVSWIPDAPVPIDVMAEQKKIAWADVLVFIYPVWWSGCPAKLKGWFDRVLTHGYAYYYDDEEQRHTKISIKKAIVICTAGHTVEHLEEIGIADSMRNIMLNDRLIGVGVQEAKMEILGGMMPKTHIFKEENLKRAYDLGRRL